MSIDSAKLVEALTASKVKVNIPVVPEKKKWSVQIAGCYDLLYKLINFDYPTREEMEDYLKKLFMQHNSNIHNFPMILNPIESKMRYTITKGTKDVYNRNPGKVKEAANKDVGYGL